MRMRPDHPSRRERQRGAVIAEFLLVFPAFLVLSMFVVEVGLMWADRHVVRLAAFEAARVFAAGTLQELADQARPDGSCEASDGLKQRALQAAVRKIAVISPPLPLFLAKLGVDASRIDFGEVPALGPAGEKLTRMAMRWPTAVASTHVDCVLDQARKQVKVTVTYERMLQTPIVDRVMFILYELGQLGQGGKDAAIRLDADMFGLQTDSPAAIASLASTLKSAVSTVEHAGMSVTDALPFLKAVPGLQPFFDRLPAVPDEIATAAAKLDQQSGVLMSLVAAVPEALRRIPVTAAVQLQREAFTKRVDGSSPTLKDAAYDGVIKGVMPLDRASPDYRKFLRDLSSATHDQDGRFGDGAAPLEAIK